MNTIPVIIDTDPGIDDFFALMLAHSNKSLLVRAITAVAGNQTLEKTAENCIRIAELLKSEARVAKGVAKPIAKDLVVAEYVHGENGIGDATLPETKRAFDKDYAWDVMYQEAKKYPKELCIIAIGPLTNVGIALLKYPDLKDYVKEIIWMGGSALTGNITAYGEFNSYVDPEAVKLVFESSIKVTMVGLNVTHQSGFSKEKVEELLSIPCSMKEQTCQMLHYLQEAHQKLGKEEVVLHDALAVAYAIDKEVLTCKDYFVTVETKGRLNAGRTLVDLDGAFKDKEKNISVAMEVNNDRYIALLKQMMNYYA